MAYSFDNYQNLSYCYFYDDSAGTYTSRNLTTGDYFDDDAVVDDILYFGRLFASGRPEQFHDLKLYVGTQLVADSITVVWEYYKDGTGWTTIPGVTDNTNAFQNAGEQIVTFSIPPRMFYGGNYYRIVNSKRCGWIRARITAVTNLTEGGAQSTQSMAAKDNTIKIDTETGVTLQDIYDEDVSNGWGQIDHPTDTVFYHVKCPIYFYNSEFSSSRELVQFGREDYPVSYMMNSGSEIQFGVLNEGYGSEGTGIYQYTRSRSGYNKMRGTFNLYGTLLIRPLGSFGDFDFETTSDVDIRDTVIVTDRHFIIRGTGNFHRTVLDSDSGDKFYVYTNDVDIDGLKMTDTKGLYCGRGAVVKNVDFGTRTLQRAYDAEMHLINCTIVNSNISNINPTAGADRYVYKKYTFDLTVLDKNGNPINGVNVAIRDTDGTSVVSTTTDASGEISQQTITAYQKWWVESESWAEYEKDFSPFILTISGTGYETYKQSFTLDAETDWTIALRRSPYVGRDAMGSAWM